MDCIQEIFAQILRESPDFDIRDADNYREVLSEMKEIADKQGEGMITLWIVADRNNQLLHSNGNTTGEDFVLATRPWFQQLVDNSGNTIVTSAYEDVVSGEMVADGNLDVDVQATSSDEVGEMANSISRLVDRLKTYILYINEVSSVIEQIGQGNLIYELEQDYVGEFNRIKLSMDEIQRSLSHTIVQIMDSAMRVDENTSQIATASQRLVQGSVEQASTVQELFATVQTLTAQSTSDSKHFLTLSKDIRSIGTELTDSNQRMQQMV